jgi:hypothetical protein
VLSRVRNQALAAADRVPVVRSLIIRALAAAARRGGAVSELLDETVEQRNERPIARSAQMIRWSRRITRDNSKLPTHFDPAEHLTSEASRNAACRALERRISLHPDDDLAARQLLRLGTSRPLDEIARDVENDVRALLRRMATTPGARKGGIAPELQLEIVSELTTHLTELGVRPFLMSGTLLGIIRDGDFMAHDYDIDLGLMPGTDLSEIPEFVRQAGYETSVQGDRIVAVHRTGARTDLFPHTERDGKFWHGSLVHEWWNTPFDLVAFEVKDHKLWIPDDPERYLDENYGDWSNPVAFYDISFDTPNRVYRQNSEALLHLHSRCVIAARSGDRWLLESAARELRDHFGVDVTELLASSALLG